MYGSRPNAFSIALTRASVSVPSDSFGSASAHFGCQYEWSMMVDPPILDAVLTAIFESDQYTPHPIYLELAT